MIEDFYAQAFKMKKINWLSLSAKKIYTKGCPRGRGPRLTPKIIQPPKPLALPPPANPYDTIDCFGVRTVIDPETGFMYITSGLVQMWIFGEHMTRFKFGSGEKRLVFGKYRELSIPEAIRERFNYDPNDFPVACIDTRRQTKPIWWWAEDDVLTIAAENFISAEILSKFFWRSIEGIMIRRGRLGLGCVHCGKFMRAWYGWERMSIRQKCMYRRWQILSIVNRPVYNGKRIRTIRLIDGS